MKLNKLILPLSCLLTVPTFGSPPMIFLSLKDFAAICILSCIDSTTTFVRNHKTGMAGGLGTAAILGGAVLYYKYSNKVNAKIKNAAQ